jgi:hypothetical protein
MKVRAVILIDMELPVANIEATRRKLTAYTRALSLTAMLRIERVVY